MKMTDEVCNNPFFIYRAEIEAIIDGDTLDVRLDCGFRFYHHARIRLVGVDTHEIYGVARDSEEYEQGQAEAEFVGNWVMFGRENWEEEWPFIVSTVKDRTGKYGRYLAEVYRRDTGGSLTDNLKQEFPDVAD